MLREVSLAVLFAVCYGYVFENGHTRVALLNPKSVDSVERFAQVAAQRKSSQWRNRAQGILRSLKNPFLLRGTPMNSFHPQQLLPLTGFQNTALPQSLGSKGHPVKLKAYSITNCSASTARESKFVIKNLSITPDPVLIPGRVKFSFDISVLTDLDNVQVKLDLLIRNHGAFVKFPCIEQFGSCTYNVCDLLKAVEVCPPELEKHNIRCHCPYKKNDYMEPGITADIQTTFEIPAADYKLTATMTSDGQFIGCYNATFTVES